MTHPEQDFVAALVNDGPQHPERMKRFGQLVGSWDVRGRRLDEAGGEWSERSFTFLVSWVLEGRGIQDLEVVTAPDGSRTTLATALRVYDPSEGIVRISYFSPESNQYCNLVVSSTWKGGIRQDGTQNDGRPIRWNFSDITDTTYVWDGWVSDDEGITWHLVEHLEGTRVG